MDQNTLELHLTVTLDPKTDRIAISELEARFIATCEPMIASLGFECAHVEIVGGSRRTVRLYIDHPEGITIDDCATVSRQLDVLLDVEDVIPGAYDLEVSSPGLDRPLGRRGDFERFAGERVKIESTEPIEGRRRWTGDLVGVQGDDVLVTVDGTTHGVPLAMIKKANVKYAFDSGQAEGTKRR